MQYVLHRILYDGRNLEKIGVVDPLLVGRAQVVFEQGESVVQPTNYCRTPGLVASSIYASYCDERRNLL